MRVSSVLRSRRTSTPVVKILHVLGGDLERGS